ncbi:MAG: hypothetical protein RL148_104 [Planctomycetota bacterium]
MVWHVVQWWMARPRVLRVAAAVACASVLWWLTAMPSRDLPEVPGGHWAMNLCHVLAFGGLAALVLGALAARPDQFDRHAILAVVLATLHGGALELLQAMSPGRSSSWGDAVSNGCGAAMAVCWLLWVTHRSRRAVLLLPLLAMVAAVSVATG